MWTLLSESTGTPPAEIDAQRRTIVAKVENRRAYIAQANYRRVYEQWEKDPPPAWWRRWLLGETKQPPRREEFDTRIDEEEQHHVVVQAVPDPARVELARQMRNFEGALKLQTTQRRVYPYAEIAAHVIGTLGQVTPGDLADDPEAENRQRRYLQNDVIGNQGLERIAERRLRGTRGLANRQMIDGTWEETVAADAVGGADCANHDRRRVQQGHSAGI